MSSPSILFINRVFPPDRGATGRCLADLAVRVASAGWRVTVLADGSGGNEALSGVNVVRTGSGSGEGKPGAGGYAASIGRLVTRGLVLPRHDVVVTMTDPPLLALVGPLLATRHGAVALHWSHDVFPALLPVLGMSLPRAVQRMLEAAATRAFARHDRVVAIGRCMAQRLAALGVPEERLSVLPNWADPCIHPVPPDRNGFRRDLGAGDRFVVAYSGNFGLAHPLSAMLDAAAAVPEALFLMIGDGRGHGALVAEVVRRNLSNLRVLPFQPAERLAESLSAADIHLAAMAPAAEGLLVPSKVAGALAAGRPCLFLGPAGYEAARRIAEGRCGVVLDPDDGSGLTRAIRAYAADPLRRIEEGARARQLAVAWDADRAAGRFLSLAAAALAAKRGAGAVVTLPAVGRGRSRG